MSRDPAVTVGIDGDASGLDQAINSATASLTDLRKTVGVVGGALGALGAGAIAGSVNAFGNFDEAMQESIAVMGDVDEGMRTRLEETAREVATATRHSHEEAAQSFYFLASAGLDAQESIAAMPEVADFAAAGNMRMADATDVATNVMSAFGYEADQMNEVTDTLAGTVANHNQTMEGMSTAMSQVAPMASELGFSIEETSAAIGMLGDVGIQGSRAGTQLRNVMSQLADPTSTAAKQLEEMGVQVRDSEGDLLSFTEILRNMQEAGVEGGDAAQLFGRRAGPAVAALLSEGSDAMEENTGTIANMEDATEEMAETQRDTLNAEIDIFRSRLNDIAITVGEAFMPTINQMMDAVNDAADGFSDLLDTVDEGTIAKVLGGGTFAAITTAITALVSGPIGLLVGAIGVLAAAWKENWGNIRETAQQAFEMVVSIWEDNQEQIMTLADTLVDTLRDFGELFFQVVGGVVDFLSDHQGTISDLIGGVIETFTTLAEVAGDVFEGISGFLEDNSGAIEGAVDGILNVFGTWIDYQRQILSSARWVFERVLVPIFDRVASAVQRNLGPVLEELGPTFDAIAAGAEKVGNVLRSVWQTIGPVVTPIVETLADVIGVTLGAAIDTLTDGVLFLMNLIQGDFEAALGNLTDALSRPIQAALDVGHIVLESIKDGIDAAVDWITSDGVDLMVDAFNFIAGTEEGGGLPQLLVDGISNGLDAIAEWIGGLDAIAWIADLGARVRRVIEEAIKDAVDFGPGDVRTEDEQSAAEQGVVNATRGTALAGAATGGFVERGGMLNVHAGEQVVQAAQVTDRGEVEAGGGPSPRAFARAIRAELSGAGFRVETGDEQLDQLIADEAELVFDDRESQAFDRLRRNGAID